MRVRFLCESPIFEEASLTLSDLALSPTAIVTAAAALIAVYVSWQQWRTARHKLAVDLFDRRLQAYRALNNAVTARHNEILALTFDQITRDPPAEALSAFWTAKSDAYFLFGPHVHRAMDRVEDRLKLLLDAKAEFTTDPDRHPSDYVKVIRYSANVFGAQDRLLEAAKPYMMMGAVGAARSLIWRKKEQLGASIEHTNLGRNDELLTNLAFGSENGCVEGSEPPTANQSSSGSPASPPVDPVP